MTYFIILLLLSALFAAMDQVVRFPERFLPISRLPERWYTWETGIRFPFPVNAKKDYQGLKLWLMSIAWFTAPIMEWWQLIIIMSLWWLIVRNFMLHTLLTKDRRVI